MSRGDGEFPALGLVCGALILWSMFFAFGGLVLDGFVLQLGGLEFPQPRYALLLLVIFGLGAPMAGLLTAAGTGLLARHDRWERWSERVDAIPDVYWWAGAGLLAVVIPLLIRLFVLEGAPLTDDEGSYWFGARLLLEGRLSVPSPPEPAFYNRFSMVNDGAFYPQYFLGWPALLAVGVALGVPGAVNPLLAGVGAVALFFLVREWFDRSEARWAVLLYVASPFVMAGAATLLSHTSTLVAVLVTHLAAVHARKPGAPRWLHAAVAGAFSVAFFIRPTVTIALGGPALAVWASTLFDDETDTVGRLVSFALPAAAMAALFLGVNWQQNGSPFRVAYQVHKQMTPVFGRAAPEGAANFTFGNASRGPAITAGTLVRFNFAIWGWFSAFLFLPFAVGDRRARPFWWAAVLFVAIHFFLHDGGIDAFGPLHYYEWTFPVVVLTAVGVVRAGEWLERLDVDASVDLPDVPIAAIPTVLVAALVYTSAITYTPVRLYNLGLVARAAATPERAAERAELDHPSVVFVPLEEDACLGGPDRARYWPPANRPDRDGRIVWLNHLTLERDREHADEYYPDRRTYMLRWRPARCRAELVPLEELDADSVDPGAAWTMLEAARGDPELRQFVPRIFLNETGPSATTDSD